MYLFLLYFIHLFIKANEIEKKNNDTPNIDDENIINNKYIAYPTTLFIDIKYFNDLDNIYEMFSQIYFSDLFNELEDTPQKKKIIGSYKECVKILKYVSNLNDNIRLFADTFTIQDKITIKEFEENVAEYFYLDQMKKESSLTKITNYSDSNDIILDGDIGSQQLAREYTNYNDPNKRSSVELSDGFESVIKYLLNFETSYFSKIGNRNSLKDFIFSQLESKKTKEERIYYTSIICSNFISHIKVLSSGIINIQRNYIYNQKNKKQLLSFCSDCIKCLENLVIYAKEVKMVYYKELKKLQHPKINIILCFPDILVRAEGRYDLINSMKKKLYINFSENEKQTLNFFYNIFKISRALR